MKKLFAFILIMCVLFPFSALSEGDSPFFGKWVGQEHHTFMKHDTILHFVEIHENSPSVYMVFNLDHGGVMSSPGAEPVVMYDSNWEIVDKHIRVPTSAVTYVDFYYNKEDGTLFTLKPKVTYVKLP